MSIERAALPESHSDDHRLPARILEGHDAFLALDRAWRLAYVNAAGERVLGRPRSELLGRVLWEACSDLAGSALERHCRCAVADGERGEYEELWPARSSWLEITAEPWDGGVVVFLRDISERKRRERRELIFRVAAAAIAGAPDMHGALSAFARSTIALTGWPYAETWAVEGATPRCLEVLHVDRPGHEQLARASRALGPGDGVVGAALLERRPRQLRDLAQLGDARAELALAAGFTSMVIVPVWAADHPFGGVVFFSESEGDDDWFRALEEQHQIAHLFERRRALEILRASEERHRLVFENSPAPMWIYEPGSLRFQDVNQAAIELYGFSRDEFLAMDLLGIRPPEEIPELSQVQQAGAPTSAWRTGLRKHWKKDRTPLYVNVASHALVLDGRSVRVVVITDLTALRLADGKLREQATLLDSANDAIVVRRLDDTITYWNRGAERTYGWPAADAIGRPFAQLTGPRGRELEAARASVAERGEWLGELSHKLRDNREAIVASRWTLVRDERGEPTSILSIGTDVTERKKLEAQYLRAQRMESIGTLAGGIAHDLNNMLTPIMMSIPLLRNDDTTPEDLELIESIETSARRGAQMVRQVLLFARGLSGERTPLRPKPLVEETRRIVTDSMTKAIEVRLVASNDLPLIDGDATQLQQVLINLAVNARDAMPDGGVLTISAYTTFLDGEYVAMNTSAHVGAHLVLEVSDTGSGIPPEIRDRIFDPFFTTKEVGKGTGLGLSTSLAIVKNHGGFFHVYSEPGKGTTFKLFLPALEATSLGEPVASVTAPQPRGNNELVLIVDDEAPIRTVTRRTLESAGYRVCDAANGAEALAAFARSSDVRVALVDMSMPVMDGAATIRALMHLDPALRIIAASGLGANGAFARATSVGVRHFLQKPFTADTLLQTVRLVLAGGEPA